MTVSETETRLNAIIESALDAIITVDEGQKIVLFNRAAERMFHCPAQQALGQPLDRFLPQRFRAGHRQHIENFGATRTSSRRMAGDRVIYALRADGEEFPLEASISHAKEGSQELYTVILRDITERKQVEQALRASHDRLRELSAALQSVREEEKTRIARELHDELGQALTAMKMDLAAIRVELQPGQIEAMQKAENMKTLIEATVKSMRRIASDLRPLMLDDLGLIPTIEWLVKDFSQRNGIEVELTIADREIETGSQTDTALFRILQEALTNVARHARASKVRITLTLIEGKVHLGISDNGLGFEQPASGATGHFGLLGIKERAALLGGQVSIHSEPGAGTTVEVDVPATPQGAQHAGARPGLSS